MDVRPIDAAGLRLVEEWLAGDPAGNAVLGGFYGRATERWEPLLRAPNRHGWITSDDEGPVGFIDLEVLDGEAEVSYYVRLDRRGKGLGRATAEQLGPLAAATRARQVYAAAGTGNVAGLASLRSVGFQELGRNEFDELEFVLTMS